MAVRMQYLSPDCVVGWCRALRAAAVSCFLTLPTRPATVYALFHSEDVVLFVFYISVTLNAWLLNSLSLELSVFIDCECAFYSYI